MTSNHDRRGLFQALIADGRPLLTLTGLALVFAGLLALFLAATGHLLPHDLAYLGITAEALHRVADGRVLHFMIHDRVAFGGSLIAIGVLYLWLSEFPLRAKEAWAWWLFAFSGAAGFGSFLLYLGYGYLDSWHAVLTLALLPFFLFGVYRTRLLIDGPLRPRSLFVATNRESAVGRYRFGRVLLLLTAASMAIGGIVIMGVGITTVFVPQDLEFMGLTAEQIDQINPRLMPLIAHDRAGFGGGVCCCGLTMFFCVGCGEPSRSLWQALLITGTAGFGAAIGVHPAIGYTDFFHLAPAYVGAIIFSVGMALTYQRMVQGEKQAIDE